MVIAYISLAYDRDPLYIGVLYSVSFPQKLKNLKCLAQVICATRAQVGFLNDPDLANIMSRSHTEQGKDTANANRVGTRLAQPC